MIDTNILISALLFPHSKPADALSYTISEHQLVLCEQNCLLLRVNYCLYTKRDDAAR